MSDHAIIHIIMGVIIAVLMWLVYWTGRQEVKARLRVEELEYEVSNLKYNSHKYDGTYAYPEYHEGESDFEYNMIPRVESKEHKMRRSY